MPHSVKKLLRTACVFYSCLCLVGCVTSRALEYVEQEGTKETLHWHVKAITFAAIRDDRFVRLCVELASETDTGITELHIDLQEITQQLNYQDAVIGGLEQGVNTESYMCSLELEAGEQELPVSVIHSDAQDIVLALQWLEMETLDGPVISLLQHETGSYLVFGAPAGMYKGLDKHAFGSYTETEHHYSSSAFILLPLAIVVDAALLVLIIPCVIPILWPICLPVVIVAGIIEEADPASYEDGQTLLDQENPFE